MTQENENITLKVRGYVKFHESEAAEAESSFIKPTLQTKEAKSYIIESLIIGLSCFSMAAIIMLDANLTKLSSIAEKQNNLENKLHEIQNSVQKNNDALLAAMKRNERKIDKLKEDEMIEFLKIDKTTRP